MEDNAGDARLLREVFDEQDAHIIELTRVERVAGAENHLSKHPVDLILLDPGLPDAQGLDSIRRIRAAAPRVALVVLTGRDDEALALQALQEGAQDYLVKGQIDMRGLLRALRYAIERKNMEEAVFAERERDVKAVRMTALHMKHLAQHDFLTGLPNRMLLLDRIVHAIALAPRHAKKVAVLYLDLDGFKEINDTRGHQAGDRLLQSIATRLVECVRGADTVSRQGGDEFVVLLSEMEQFGDAEITAKRMLQAVAEAHSIAGPGMQITTSIGISIYPEDGENAETLIKNADAAMYQAKENGRRSYQFFRPAVDLPPARAASR